MVNPPVLKLSEQKFDEPAAKLVFDYYQTDKDTDHALSADDLSRFLFDLLEQNGRKAVVPPGVLDTVVKTLVLNPGPGRSSVSYIEWKSFFVYLSNRPLETLLQKASEPFGERLSKCRFFALRAKDRTVTPDVDALKKVIKGTEKDPIYLSLDFADYKIYVAEPGVETVQEENQEEKQEPEWFSEDLKKTYELEKCELSHFPPVVMRGVGENKRVLLNVSKKVAGVYVTSKQAVTKTASDLTRWDQENLNVGAAVGSAWSGVSSFWKANVEPGIQTAFKTATTTVDQTLEKSGMKEKFGEAATVAKARTSEMKQRMMANPVMNTISEATKQTSNNVRELHLATKREINKRQAVASHESSEPGEVEDVAALQQNTMPSAQATGA